MSGSIEDQARTAAAAIRAVMERRKETGVRTEPDGKIHASARPKFYWMFTWSEMPGLMLTIGGSTRSNVQTKTYSHELLPDWQYESHELWELLQDLDNLAAGKGQPTAPTRNPKTRRASAEGA